MIQSVKELHVYLDARLAVINSNRQLNISPEYKDLYLNTAVLQFIESRSSNKLNSKKEGFEDTEKRYDDLRMLKVREISSTIYSDDLYGVPAVYTILPKDYYKLIPSGRSYIKYDCNGVTKLTTPVTDTYIILNFPNDTTTGTSRYTNVVIVSGSTTISIPAYGLPIRSTEGKFIIVQHILSILLALGINVYWERYDNIYQRDSFIIVGQVSGSLSYIRADNTVYTNSVIATTRTLNEVNTLKNETIVENELISSDYTIDSLGNYYAQRNRHKKPQAFITGSRYYVIHNDKFVPTSISFEYIKKPLLISLLLNQVCEIQQLEEIGNIAAQLISADVQNPQLYQLMTQSNLKSE